MNLQSASSQFTCRGLMSLERSLIWETPWATDERNSPVLGSTKSTSQNKKLLKRWKMSKVKVYLLWFQVSEDKEAARCMDKTLTQCLENDLPGEQWALHHDCEVASRVTCLSGHRLDSGTRWFPLLSLQSLLFKSLIGALITVFSGLLCFIKQGDFLQSELMFWYNFFSSFYLGHSSGFLTLPAPHVQARTIFLYS